MTFSRTICQHTNKKYGLSWTADGQAVPRGTKRYPDCDVLPRRRSSMPPRCGRSEWVGSRRETRAHGDRRCRGCRSPSGRRHGCGFMTTVRSSSTCFGCGKPRRSTNATRGRKCGRKRRRICGQLSVATTASPSSINCARSSARERQSGARSTMSGRSLATFISGSWCTIPCPEAAVHAGHLLPSVGSSESVFRLWSAQLSRAWIPGGVVNGLCEGRHRSGQSARHVPVPTDFRNAKMLRNRGHVRRTAVISSSASRLICRSSAACWRACRSA